MARNGDRRADKFGEDEAAVQFGLNFKQHVDLMLKLERSSEGDSTFDLDFIRQGKAYTLCQKPAALQSKYSRAERKFGLNGATGVEPDLTGIVRKGSRLID